MAASRPHRGASDGRRDPPCCGVAADLQIPVCLSGASDRGGWFRTDCSTNERVILEQGIYRYGIWKDQTNSWSSSMTVPPGLACAPAPRRRLSPMKWRSGVPPPSAAVWAPRAAVRCSRHGLTAVEIERGAGDEG